MTERPERPRSPEPEPRAPDPHAPATVDGSLRLVKGFSDAERPEIVAKLHRLEPLLEGYTAEQVDLALDRKDATHRGQAVTLVVSIAGYPELVADAEDEDVDRALGKVRDEMDRELRTRKNKREQHERDPYRR
ncbi:HPF/RaiA family ribosome-associated protein [Cellulomonas sp. P22]|uniref:HPF/RaiA family ribosome-associated protein n=1 Tax=Cellulomonas sp. P22 TaxID=3373189 RepID=UPI0037A6791A